MNSKTLSEEKESEENRSLSKFVRQRRKKSPNSTSKSKWNPFKKIAKIVTGASSTTTTSSSEPTDVLLAEDCVMRWTATCLNATCPIFAKNPQFNMTYCTIPSLLMFICVKFASEAVGAKFMDRLFELSEQDLAELAEICEMLQKCSTSTNNFYCFVRFLVDEEKTTTVSKELMAQCKKLTNQKVFASIRPSRAIKYLAGLSFGAPGALELSRPALLTTNGYGSCGLVAKWSGKTKSIGRQRFASTYHRMIMEPFFELSTKFRRISDEHFDVFEIDFEAGTLKNPGSLLIFRPHFIGNLPYSNRTIKPETIAKIMTKLENSERIRGTILLPEFCVTSNHDLWKNLLRQGVQPDLGQSQKLPPIASLHHWTSVCVNERGICAKIEGDWRKQKKLEHGRIPLRYEKHQPYSARIDSSFSYIFLLKGIPIFTGSYFGSFPPRSSEIFIKVPNQLAKNRRKKTPPKKYVKPTRRQNLRKKAAKNDEKNRAKFKKSASKSTETEESKSKSASISKSEPKSKSKKIRKVFNFLRRKK